ncbi:MAG TPA: PadR family transcriptional regulator [Longimicrobiales bacterium]|nr:PadR family transcriptional regulator [Longimicrobiales bacterium]
MAGSDLYTGTLDVVILKALSGQAMHGYAIGLWIRRHSREVLEVKEGVLYPALHRVQRRGWVESRWGETDTGRRAKFYALTAQGRARLESEAARLAEYSEAVLSILNHDPAPG